MNKRKLTYNVSWLFFDKALRILGSLFVGIWIARYLGPHDFGILNYALAFTGFFMVFVKLGLDQVIVREVVKKPKLTPYLLGTGFVLKLIGALFAMGSVCLSLLLTDMGGVTKLIILIISAGFVFQTVDVIDYFYQAKVLSKYAVFARSVSFIVGSILQIYLILHNYTVVYFACVIVFQLLLSGLLLLSIYKALSGNITRWKYSWKIAKQLLLYSWPLALSSFLIAIHMKVDQVMIGNMLSVDQVGVYSVAVRLAEFWLFIPGILVSTLMPYFIDLRRNDNDLYQYRLTQLYSLMFWVGVCVGVVVIIFGEYIIKTMFGVEYVGAYQPLVINIWNGIFISQALARGIWMISENLQKYRLYNNVIVVILNISMNLWLIPKLGIAGAALATLATQVSGTWFFSFFWKPLRFSTWQMIKSVNPMYLLNKKGIT